MKKFIEAIKCLYHTHKSEYLNIFSLQMKTVHFYATCVGGHLSVEVVDVGRVVGGLLVTVARLQGQVLTKNRQG